VKKMFLIRRSGEEFESACSQYLKHVEAEAHEHVPLSWEKLLPLPFKHPLGLFSLVSHMLSKFVRKDGSP